MAKIKVISTELAVRKQAEADYISLTDIARYKHADRTDDLIRNWLRSRNTIEFLGIWEQLNNPNFKPVEFDGFRKLAGRNSFTLRYRNLLSPTNVQMNWMPSPRCMCLEQFVDVTALHPTEDDANSPGWHPA